MRSSCTIHRCGVCGVDVSGSSPHVSTGAVRPRRAPPAPQPRLLLTHHPPTPPPPQEGLGAYAAESKLEGAMASLSTDTK